MPSILVVDDEPGVRSSLSGVLRDEGFDVEAAASGEECLDRAARTPYDVIVLDVWLPGVDGLVTLQRLRERQGRRAGGDDLRPRQHRIGRARDQDGRVRLRREAAVAREDRAGRAQRAAPARSRSREPRAARARRSPARDGGRELRHAAAARAGRDGGADQRPRADLRRERHRQGAGRAHHPPVEPPAQRPVRRGQLRGDSRRS